MGEEKKIKKTKVEKRVNVGIKKIAAPKIEKKTDLGKSNRSNLVTTENSLLIDIYDTNGIVAGSIELPKEIFDAKINKALIAQAIRVYLMNQRRGTVSTKSRGEVAGSTRKIYRQKGTGRARHGGIRAPIFVKGGIAHGSKPRDFSLELPKKMKKAALFSALTAKKQENAIKVISNLAAVDLKTKQMAVILKKLQVSAKTLIIMPSKIDNVYKAGRNIKNVDLTSADKLNTYEVLHHTTILFMEESFQTMRKVFLKEQ